MKRIFALFVCLLCVFGHAAAQPHLMPALDDPQAQAVQRLNIMSQRDEAFEGIKYDEGKLTLRGCQPVSVTNGLIASLGIEDRETAVELVKEAAQVLIERPWLRGKVRMHRSRVETMLSVEDRALEAEEFPMLDKVIGGYEGEITVLDQYLDIETVIGHFADRQTKLLVGWMRTHPEWGDLLEIMQQLYDAGMKDAMVCLANVSVGRGGSGTPLGSGQSGHYVTALMYVDTFVEEGRVYILDSLPRALVGEESGGTNVLRQPYPFTEKRGGFIDQFDARRIRDTVIELKPVQERGWQNATIEEREKILNPLIFYGLGIMTVSWKAENE